MPASVQRRSRRASNRRFLRFLFPLRAGRFALIALGSILAGCDPEGVFRVAVPLELGISLVMVGEASSAIDPFEEADNVRVRVQTPDGQAVQQTFELPSDENEVRLAITVPVQGDQATVVVTVQLRRGSIVLLETSESTVVTRGEDNQVELRFVLQGATVAVGHSHACALTASGQAHCWGSNGSGQLGTGDEASTTTPRPVAGDLRFREIAAGSSTTCALTREGEAYCWGSTPLGQEGVTQSSTPIAVSGGLVFDQIDVSGFDHACGLDPQGQAFCWGTNRSGELGTGNTIDSPVPAPVRQDGLAFRSISTGLAQTCAITLSGDAFCWGSGNFFSLGTGEDTRANHSSPAPVAGGHTFSQLEAGATTTCAVTEGQSPFCWGLDIFGSLGTGSTSAASQTSPAPVAGAQSFATVGAGGENSVFSVNCGLTSDGSAFCWGPNVYGALGSRTAPDTCGPIVNDGEPFGCSGVPQPVQGGLQFIALAPSQGFTCGLTADRDVFCWGQNSSGQLGAETSDTCNALGEDEACSFEPVRVGLPEATGG